MAWQFTHICVRKNSAPRRASADVLDAVRKAGTPMVARKETQNAAALFMGTGVLFIADQTPKALFTELSGTYIDGWSVCLGERMSVGLNHSAACKIGGECGPRNAK